LVAAVLVATVLPRLIRDRSPHGSDRPSMLGNGAGHHRRHRGAHAGPPPAAEPGPDAAQTPARANDGS
jgi:hypothetical protein